MKGIYALIIYVSKEKNVIVGSLGPLTFKRGFYVYVGSAQNNLERRITRHFDKSKRVFWHIDYLLKDGDAEIVNVLFKRASREEECRLALALSSSYEPIKGFGSSDCKCQSHLFRIDDYKGAEMFLRRFGLNHFKRMK
ncbi:MAG: GIY-YIG nuclease family protein [Candidatus Bathyarchaeia archaeon]|nr:GIY-YIG nuclease family protein [Candidatus Bathyarchaeota archaeon]